MMKKIYVVFYVLFTVVTAANASLYQVPLAEKVQHATLIVEGTVESQHAFWNPAHTFIFTSNHIKISKQFSGAEVGSGYIDVLTQGGSVDNFFTHASDLLKLQQGERGVFFAYPNTFGLKDPQTGELLLDIWSSSQGVFKYSPVETGAGAPFVHYEDVEKDLYPELERVIGHAPKVIDPAFKLNSKIAYRGTAAVTGFLPAHVRAGAFDDAANNVLTINGSGFGAAPSGSCAVYFDDADDGTGVNFYGVPYNDVRIVSWTDAQIQVKVPTNAGTGVFYVTNSAGANIAQSASNLIVDFAVLSAGYSISSVNYYKEYNLMNTNGAGGYTVTYSNNAAGSGTDFNASTAKATFQRALNTWKGRAGFNVLENATPAATQTVSSGDGINIVQYDNTNTGTAVLPSGVLAVCYSGGSVCTSTPTTQGFQKTGFDITVRSSASAGSAAFTAGPCAPNTAGTETDLETVILHELGHAIGEGHINDNYQYTGVGSYTTINPGKLMNYAVLPSVKRVSPDWSALTAAVYLVATSSHTYGNCGLATTEMTPLATTLDANDECPGTFPSTATLAGTTVNFDLSKATSNYNKDPQYNSFNGTGGTGVTNTVFYAFKTKASTGTLNMTISNYQTTPTAQAACASSQGVEYSIYLTAACPTGQAFGTPVANGTFTGNGPLIVINSLAANTNYLLVMDGVYNTFAAYTLSLRGSTVLPLSILAFSGNAAADANRIAWEIGDAEDVAVFELERSIDGKAYATIYTSANRYTIASGNFDDKVSLPEQAYYRLKLTAKNGEETYSKNVLLRHALRNNISIAQAGPNTKPYLFSTLAAAEAVAVLVTDASGREVAQSSLMLGAGTAVTPLSLPLLASGIYLVQVKGAAGVVLTVARIQQ